MKTYSVYIVKCSDQSYYVGISNNPHESETRHNQGLDPKAYTYQRRSVKLVWHQEFTDLNLAIAKEKQIKGWNRKNKEALIAGNYKDLPKLSMNSLRQAQTDHNKEGLSGSSLRQAQTDNSSILAKLPYEKPFLFVDDLLEVGENGARGRYTFSGDEDFYKGHFKNNPVTPGVILTECCAQIGMVCLGIFLIHQEDVVALPSIAFSESQMEFLIPVYPNETVTVISEKIYYRFHKLKCRVKMFNAHNELVCKGILSGMIINKLDGK